MKAGKFISLLAGIAFFAAFAVCPAFAGSDDLSGQYVPAPEEHNLINGTIDYLGSVVNVFRKGTWETFDSTKALLPKKCCGEKVEYRPNMVMNRGSRWRRGYTR